MLSILGEKRMASWYIYSSRGPVSVTCSSARAPANLISLGLHTKTQPPVSVALPLSSDCHHTAVSSPKAENCPAHTWLFTCGSVMSLDSLWYIWEGEAAGEWTGQGSGRRGWLGGWEECTEPAVLPMGNWTCGGDVRTVTWAPQESGSESGTVKKLVTETLSLTCENHWQEAWKAKKWGEMAEAGIVVLSR